MRLPTARQVAVPLVVLLVVLAGCSGGGGGDGGDGAASPTTAPAEDVGDDGGADDGSDDGSDGAGDGDSADGADDGSGDGSAGDGDSGDGDSGDGSTSDGDSGDGSADDGSDDSGDGVGVSPAAHEAALKEAGSYTLEYRIDGFFGSGGSFAGTQQVNLDTGERFARLNSTTQGQSYIAEFYQGPDADTAYQQAGGQVQEVPPSEAFFLEFSEPDSGIGVGEYGGFEKAGTEQTDMGSATRYVIDSVDDLPDSETSGFDSVKDVRFEMLIDDDTGLIVEYVYDLTYVQDGEEGTLTIDFRMKNVGSTTVDKPDWVPTS